LFGHLQSGQSQQLLRDFPELTDQMKTVILLEDGRVFTRSTAALRIARRLDGMWPLWYGLIILPAFVRDAVYNLIATYRYRLFGRSNDCQVPSPEDKDRFID
jgi:predicted DCC family thiol-disulfide oxidoreductase YuxK